MKNLLFLFLVFIMSAQIVFGANVSDERRNAYKNMTLSNKLLHETCLKIADNFRYDHQFARYVKYRCQLFESDRQRLLDTVYTISSSSVMQGATANYTQAKSALIINVNNNEINTYKAIVNEYCKYNAYKFAKNNPQACSSERIQSLFQTMP